MVSACTLAGMRMGVIKPTNARTNQARRVRGRGNRRTAGRVTMVAV